MGVKKIKDTGTKHSKKREIPRNATFQPGKKGMPKHTTASGVKHK